MSKVDLSQKGSQIFLQYRWVLLGISKELGICNHDETRASPPIARERENFYREEKKVLSGTNKKSIAFHRLGTCRESFFSCWAPLSSQGVRAPPSGCFRAVLSRVGP